MNKPWYKSYKLWLSIITVVLAALREEGLNIPLEVDQIILLGLGLIFAKAVSNIAIGLKAKNGMPVPSEGTVLPTGVSFPTPIPPFKPVVYDKPAFNTWDRKEPIPFDWNAAIAEVEDDARKRGGLLDKDGKPSWAAQFFVAKDHVQGVAAPWRFNNIEALKEAWQFINVLGGKAFEEIWGTTYEQAMLTKGQSCSTCDPQKWSGCTFPDLDFAARQFGMEFYFILRQFREAKETLSRMEVS